MRETILIGADHAGYDLKETVRQELLEKGFYVEDVGCHSDDRSTDYPLIAHRLAERLENQPEGRAILCCGSGAGMAIAANRHKGIRAVVAHDVLVARLAREHNNANVLCLGARIVASYHAIEILDTWLSTHFAGERHEKRVAQIDEPTTQPA